MAGDVAAQRARARERNGTRSGSSGITKAVAGVRRHTFDELASELVHVADVVGQVGDMRVYKNGAVAITLVLPPEYAHEAMDVVQRSRTAFTMLRTYHVPRPAVLDDEDEDGS